MTTRVFDASIITKRKNELAVAGSFLSRLYPTSPAIQPQNGSAPYNGITSNSIMNAVKTGNMTEYTRYPLCVEISPGCPCPQANNNVSTTNYVIPGLVSNIVFTVGSIIVSWDAPTTGTGPFTYLVTPYLNGVAQPAITTSQTSYRFTGLQEWQPYSFNVCAMNSGGSGPTLPSSYFIAPPSGLSNIMNGSSVSDIEPSLKYVINSGLNKMLEFAALKNLGPTKGSRIMYIWITSIVGAWNWVRAESRISRTHDEWNWDDKIATKLSDTDSILWLCSVIDYITPFFIVSGYKSIFNCPQDVIERVKTAGEWDTWANKWQTWYDNRQNDGAAQAATLQPTTSANWDKTIIIDGGNTTDFSTFSKPQEWTSLTVMGVRKNYLTYSWDSVKSSCLTEEAEQNIQESVKPLTGAERDNEIDVVKNYTAQLTDEQKIIAEFWAGGPGTVSPPLMFIWMWKEYIKTISISCPNIMFSLQDLAIHLFEGGRVTWRLKAAYMEARPIQEIRRRYTGQIIESWNGTVNGSQWVPYQMANFITPPFADFPSGHSHFSKAFALTMNKWFSDSIVKNNTFYDNQTLLSPLFKENQNAQFGTLTINKGASEIQPDLVPNTPINLSFDTWDDVADQAGISRLYGGIHALTAHTSSQTAATAVHNLIQQTWNIRTAN